MSETNQQRDDLPAYLNDEPPTGNAIAMVNFTCEVGLPQFYSFNLLQRLSFLFWHSHAK